MARLRKQGVATIKFDREEEPWRWSRPKAEPATAGRRLSGAPAEGRGARQAAAGPVSENYAALRFGWMRPRSTSSSAICTAFSAAPLRRLSETIHMASPFSTVPSSRMREM
jgi:hypothetical protein